MNRLITIRTFENAMQAYLVKSFLEDEGIQAYVNDEFTITMMPYIDSALSGVKLKVSEENAQEAHRLLKEIENLQDTNSDGTVLTCPNCGSVDILSNVKSARNGKGILSLFIAFLFMIYPFGFNRVNKCKTCNNEFENEEYK